MSRDQLLPLIASLPPCLIGMEACSGAHHWARLFSAHGHTVRLIKLPGWARRCADDLLAHACLLDTRITKAGDAYIRSLLLMGARAILASVDEKQNRFSRWVRELVERRGYWKAAVSIAAKNARLA